MNLDFIQVERINPNDSSWETEARAKTMLAKMIGEHLVRRYEDRITKEANPYHLRLRLSIPVEEEK